MRKSQLGKKRASKKTTTRLSVQLLEQRKLMAADLDFLMDYEPVFAINSSEVPAEIGEPVLVECEHGETELDDSESVIDPSRIRILVNERNGSGYGDVDIELSPENAPTDGSVTLSDEPTDDSVSLDDSDHGMPLGGPVECEPFLDGESVDVSLVDDSSDAGAGGEFITPVSLSGDTPLNIPPLPEEPVFDGEPVEPISLSNPRDPDVSIDLDDSMGTEESIDPRTPDIAINVFWNSTNPGDVDLDGSLSPLDALNIINAINTYGSGQISELSKSWSTVSASIGSVDVNNDSYLSALDVLMVVNQMNSSSTVDNGRLAGSALPTLPAPSTAPTMVILEEGSADSDHECGLEGDTTLSADRVDLAMQDVMSYAFAMDDVQLIRTRSRR